MGFRLLGVGSPLVDYSLAVSDGFLAEHVPGGKGASRPVSTAEKDAVLRDAPHFVRTPGGSAANTMRIFGALGGDGGFFARIGADGDGEFFRAGLRDAHIREVIPPTDDGRPNGCCVTLVTPDAERTMLFCRAESPVPSEADVAAFDFGKFDYVHVEGYLLDEPWLGLLLKRAADAGCRISMDLNNFEMVSARREAFMRAARESVDLLFANQEEITALFDGAEMASIIDRLPGLVQTAVVKLGAAGSMIVTAGGVVRVPALPDVTVKDTTGAGDYYAGGFFRGLSLGCDWETCGRIGTLCAGEIIRVTGTVLDAAALEKLGKMTAKEAGRK